MFFSQKKKKINSQHFRTCFVPEAAAERMNGAFGSSAWAALRGRATRKPDDGRKHGVTLRTERVVMYRLSTGHKEQPESFYQLQKYSLHLLSVGSDLRPHQITMS